MDTEKVIKGLDELSGFLFKEYGKVQAEEANIYYDRFLLVDNAIALLRDRETVDPFHRCVGDCHTLLERDDGVMFCPYCGRPVKWDGDQDER